MANVDEVINEIRQKANPANLEGMSKFGISIDRRFGLSVPDMRKLAKKIGRDHNLALELWKTGIDDVRIVAGMIADPQLLTGEQMDDWVKNFNSWDVCDQVCMNLFDKSPLAWQKVRDWSVRDEEFVKRAAYALIACLAWHDKKADDSKFIEFLPVIKQGADDNRNYVKKSVNWALRHIGKRNLNLNAAALRTAREIQQMDSKSARWIASDAIRELESEAVHKRLKS